MRGVILLLFACGGDGDKKGGVAQELQPCLAPCPDGTRKAAYSDLEIVSTDAFYVIDNTCESVCEPIAPCVWPNVPAVSAAGYACNPLPGFNDFLPPAEVAFGWSDVPLLAEPWQIDTSFNTAPDWLLAGYLDADAFADVVVVSGSLVETFLGNGLGGFAAATSDLSDPIVGADLADLDGDGLDDLVTRSATGAGTLELRRYDSVGDGTFAAPTTLLALGTAGWGPVVRDVDANGTLDVVLHDAGALDGMHVGWDIATTPTWQLLSTPCGTCNTQVHVADLDGNGLLDVWSEDGWWTQGPAQVFSRGTGAALQPGAGELRWPMRLVDVTGDGLADLLIDPSAGGYSTAPAIAVGDGSGQFGFGEAIVSTCSPPLTLAAGDLDGDGLAEMVAGAPDCDEVLIAYPSRYDTDATPGPETLADVYTAITGAPLVADFDGSGTDRVVVVIP